MSDFNIEDNIELTNSIMIIGLDGWGNAGEVSTFSVKYLADKLGFKKLGIITTEKFHNYYIKRPTVSIKDGKIEAYNLPRNDLFYLKTKGKKPNLVLLLGFEPHLNWSKYVDTIFKIAEKIGVKKIYTIGGYFADITPDSEKQIVVGTNNSRLLDKMKNNGIHPTNYDGPTSIYSEILWKAKGKKINVISLWTPVPLYIEGLDLKAAQEMLEKLKEIIDIKLELNEIEDKAKAFNVQIHIPDDIRENDNYKKQEKKPAYIF